MSAPRCGSIIVDLGLKFNSTTKEQDVIITLNDAVKDGKLGEFSVGAIKGKRPDVEPTGRGATSPVNGGISPHNTSYKSLQVDLWMSLPCTWL